MARVIGAVMSAVIWVGNNWLIVCGGIVLLLLLCWVAGYFLNGLLGYKFDLGSVWVGVGVFTAATMLGFGKEIAVDAKELYQYYLDSKYNSCEGVKPDKEDNHG